MEHRIHPRRGGAVGDGGDVLRLQRLARGDETGPVGRHGNAGFGEQVFVDQNAQGLPGERDGVDLAIGPQAFAAERIGGQVFQLRHVGGAERHQVVGLGQRFQPAIGAHMQHVRPFAAGEGGGDDGVVVFVREGFKLHGDAGIGLGEVREQVGVDSLVFLPPGPEGDFPGLCRAERHAPGRGRHQRQTLHPLLHHIRLSPRGITAIVFLDHIARVVASKARRAAAASRAKASRSGSWRGLRSREATTRHRPMAPA